MLQEVLKPFGSIAAKTCRYARCPHPHSVMPAGTHCLSLEPRALCDLKYYYLGNQPLASLAKVKQSKKGRHGLYGLGKRQEECYCVGCYETMLEIYRRCQLEFNPNALILPGHPIFEVMYCVDCEERTIDDRPSLGPLDQSIHYGTELFKARWLWNRREANPNYIPKNTPHHSDFLGFILGREPKSIYINAETKDYGGKFADGTTAEIPGDEVDNCSLSEALNRLVRRRIAHEEAKNERERLASHNAYRDDGPLNDPSDYGPASPRRVNPQVPIIRTTQDPPKAREGPPGDIQNNKAAKSNPPKDIADRTDASKTKDSTAPPAKVHSPDKGDRPSSQASTRSRATKSPPPSGSPSSLVDTKTSNNPSKATGYTSDKPTGSKDQGQSASTKDIQKGERPAIGTVTGAAPLKSAPSASAHPPKIASKSSAQGKNPAPVTATGTAALTSPPPSAAHPTRTASKSTSQDKKPSQITTPTEPAPLKSPPSASANPTRTSPPSTSSQRKKPSQFTTTTNPAPLKSPPSASAEPTKTTPSTSAQGKKPSPTTTTGSATLKSPPRQARNKPSRPLYR